MTENVYIGSSVEDAFHEANRRWRSQRDSDPNRLSTHDLVEQAFAAHGLAIVSAGQLFDPSDDPDDGASPGLDIERLALAMMNTLPDILDWEMHTDGIAAEYARLAPPLLKEGSR